MKIAITGAAGTIGSALCAEYTRMGWIVYAIDINENGLYYLSKDLPIVPVVQDISSTSFWAAFYDKNDIDLVINCAACKQLPMVEQHPFWAMRVNAFSVESACQSMAGIPLVHISTDKAVYPVSLYGFTKFVGEELAKWCGYNIIRLVNVLGSRGSVAEVFDKQIATGGPVTITDMHMVRHFTTIDEVVRLISLVANKSPGLYMQHRISTVSIRDMAVEAINRSGKDIPIRVTGIRPGEKIIEDLRYNDETIRESSDNLDSINSPERFTEEQWLELRSDIDNAGYSKYSLLKTMWKWIPDNRISY